MFLHSLRLQLASSAFLEYREPCELRCQFIHKSLLQSSCITHGRLVKEWHFSCRTLLFVLLSFVCLASSSQSLNRYAIFPNNHVCLASFCEPHSVTSVVLDHFHNVPGQSFAFVSIAGLEPTIYSLEGNCITVMQYCEPTSMCCPSCTISC